MIGLGLIGGSLGMALRRRGIEVRGVDSSRGAVVIAKRRRLVSRAGSSIADGVRGAGAVFLCVPMQSMEKVMREVASAADAGTIVTDVGSVKLPVVEMARRIMPVPSVFVGGHPMAGSEKSGAGFASPGLFRDRVCILTPVSGTNPVAVSGIAALWRLAGARVVGMAPRRHDEAVARVSHLPHAVAVALVLAAGRDKKSLQLVSGGFMDGTRISLGDPHLWEGIFRSNRGEILGALAGFEGEVRALRRAIVSRRGAGLRKLLSEARSIRSNLRREAE